MVKKKVRNKKNRKENWAKILINVVKTLYQYKRKKEIHRITIKMGGILSKQRVVHLFNQKPNGLKKGKKIVHILVD